MTRKQPTQNDFDKLLAWLDPDRDRAGELYEKIQRKLIGVFACHGCPEPEDLADRTINVVTSKIDWLIANFVGDPAPYFYAVAKKIRQETSRKKTAPFVPQPDPPSEEEQKVFECLDECLAELSQSDRELVLEYHQGQKREKILNRERLAEKRGMTRNALRIKVYYLRSRLRQNLQMRLNERLDE